MNKIKFMYSAYSQFKCFTFCYIHSVLHVSTKRDEYVEKDTNLEEFHTNTVTLMKAQWQPDKIVKKMGELHDS